MSSPLQLACVFDMIFNLLKLALQCRIFCDYPSNVLQYLGARLCVHHNLHMIVANTCGKSHVVRRLGLVVISLGIL